MKTSLLGAALAVGIFAAGCSGNGASPLPGTGTNPNGAFTKLSHTESVPAGWAATATQRVPIKNFPTASVPETTQLRIVVGLRMRDAAGAQQLVRSQFTPGHASFQKWLMPDQFTAMFNPSYKQAHEVAEYLKKQGFTQVEIEPNQLIVSAHRLRRARRSRIPHLDPRHGRRTEPRCTATSNRRSFPRSSSGIVAAVLGLTNAYQMHVHLMKSQHMRPMTAGTPAPCLEVVNGICIGGEYGPPQYQVAYDVPVQPAHRREDRGRGDGRRQRYASRQRIFARPRSSGRFRTFRTPSCRSARRAPIRRARRVGSRYADLQRHGRTRIAALRLRHDLAQRLRHRARVQQLGRRRPHSRRQLVLRRGRELRVRRWSDDARRSGVESGRSSGQTMFASTGDNGAGVRCCCATGAPNSGAPEVCYPASSPYVVAVGGTTLDTNANGNGPGTYYGEYVWTGTGGGFSAFESAPYWQTNGICAVCAPAFVRGIADIAMCGDNNGCPMDVFVNGTQEGVGGTSLRRRCLWESGRARNPLPQQAWLRGTGLLRRVRLLRTVPDGLDRVRTRRESRVTIRPRCLPIPRRRSADSTTSFTASTESRSAAPGWDEPSGLGTSTTTVMQQDSQTRSSRAAKSERGLGCEEAARSRRLLQIWQSQARVQPRYVFMKTALYGRIFFGASAVLFGAICLMWHDPYTWQSLSKIWSLPFGTAIGAALMAAQVAGGVALPFPRSARLASIVLGVVTLLFSLACVPGRSLPHRKSSASGTGSSNSSACSPARSPSMRRPMLMSRARSRLDALRASDSGSARFRSR